MRHITQNGLDLIKGVEGFSRTVYFCSADYPIIGYDHVVKDDEDFSADTDKAQGEELLRQDAQIAECAVLYLINVSLTDGQCNALVSLTYHLGGGHSNRSTLRSKISCQKHSQVAEKFMRWLEAARKLRRPAAVAELYAV